MKTTTAVAKSTIPTAIANQSYVTVRTAEGELPAIHNRNRGICLVRDLTPEWTGNLLDILSSPFWEDLLRLSAEAPSSAFKPTHEVEFAPPYRTPAIIWGIGLNYREHATDLAEAVPEEPASFLKGRHTIIGHEDLITLPVQSQRTTSEAELAIIVGRQCRDVEPDDALDHIAGFTTVLDQTAEDILERNPRFLTRSKNFPGFFSFGPEVIPTRALLELHGDLANVEVSTVLNDQVHRLNSVANMRYSPEYLLSFHSKVMELQPGDIISTGTPGAAVVNPGDTVECHIEGFLTLRNRVVSASEN
ncbi:fumarylacetoacetate hydrolase family protein [Cellulosimicrobium funkei]|nr:fumarylacetoacetate hydrolase family protein [Cellulosimicrobium funkei]